MLNTHNTCILLDSIRIKAFDDLKNASNASNTAYAAIALHKQAVDNAEVVVDKYSTHLYQGNMLLFIALLQYHINHFMHDDSLLTRETKMILRSIISQVQEK